MFSFRRKPKAEPEEPRIRGSPSLPELNSQGIPWPESLIDVSSIEQDNPRSQLQQGAAKTSFSGGDRAPIPFHKPFRPSSGQRPEGQTISSLYMTNTSLEDSWRTAPPKSTSKFSQKRVRVPPTFNLMVRAFELHFFYAI